MPFAINEATGASRAVEEGWDLVAGEVLVAELPVVWPPAVIAAARENLATANTEYTRASSRIAALDDVIADEDYDGTSEAAVKALRTEWVAYRKALRAYIATADGAAALPAAPDATS